MTFFEGYLFYACLVLLLIPAVILGIWQKPLRFYSLFVSLVFIGLVFGGKFSQMVCLGAFYLLELILIKTYLFLHKKYGRKQSIYYGAVLISILPLIINKVSPLLHVNFFGFLGLSYLTFKSVQMIIEVYDEVITEVSTLEFTGFLLFFPALSCGPIDRSRRFHEDWIRSYGRQEYLGFVGDGLLKLLLGFIYKLVLAGGFYKLMGFFDSSDGYSILGYAYAYGFYLFFDFAGYSLMAIGTSYILGVRTPDNFKRPFAAIDMRDFWDRWHITLSHWFRDFIFSRFIIKCVKKKWLKDRLQRASVGLFINMFIMGMWHGLTGSYLLYGMYHGILLAITEVYQKKSQFYKKNKEKRLYQIMSWFITLQLVMFGFLIFSGKLLEII